MLIKIGIGLVVVIGFFLVYVSTREAKFHYESGQVIQAEPEKIFPYLQDFKKGAEWSPYEKADPQMKKAYSGAAEGEGSVLEFEGTGQSGSGKLEILKVIPNELVEIKLTMLTPIHAENLVQYKLVREGSGTKLTWSMSGEGGFFSKLMTVFIDCEKMMTDQFNLGLNNLKALVEK